MSDQSQTAANTPAEPVLCKLGCGFFGNQATGGCCSKCWRESQKKKGVESEARPAPKKKEEALPVDAAMSVEKTVVSETNSVEEDKKEEEKPATTAVATPAKKKKGKKKSYKSMMAGMMHSTPNRDVQKEKEALRKVTGGGAFQKVEKI